MTFRSFEEIVAWQTARKVVKSIYSATRKEGFGRDYALRDQARKAAISIMANIAEGFSRRSDREFIHFLFTAKASAAETQSHVYVALDLGYLDPQEFEVLYDDLDRCARQTSNLISFLMGRRRSDHRNSK